MASLRSGENFQGGYLLHPSAAAAAAAQPWRSEGVTLHVILMLHKSAWLAVTEASGGSRGGQEGQVMAFEGRPVQDDILEFLPFLPHTMTRDELPGRGVMTFSFSINARKSEYYV